MSAGVLNCWIVGMLECWSVGVRAGLPELQQVVAVT